MNEFLVFNAGNLATILSFLIGGTAFAYTLRGDIKLLGLRISSVETEAIELRKVVVELARQEERLTAMDQRMLSQGHRVDAQGERLTSMDQRLLTMSAKVDRIIDLQHAS